MISKKTCTVLAAVALTVQGCAVVSSYKGDSPLTTVKNGLTWQRRDDGVARIWADALSYCENLALAGAKDWRLPDVKELEALTDDRQHTPAIDTEAFPETKTAGYWSSTTLADNPRFAWFVYFNNGYVNPVDKSHEYYTRCVCGGKVPRNPAP